LAKDSWKHSKRVAEEGAARCVEHKSHRLYSDDLTPLHVACGKGHVQVFKELVDHGADIHGWTPLHFACMNCHMPVVIELLNPNESNDTTTSILGKRKSRGGANTEAKNGVGDTPLHKACFYGHLPVVKALLSGGVDILAANNDGDRPIHLAVGGGHSAVAKYLLQQLYATTRRLPLHELLHDLKWIPNKNSVASGMPQLCAALHQDVLGTDDVVEIIEFLVDRNPAWISSHDQDGSLPLHLACRHGAAFTIVHSGESLQSLRQECDFWRRLVSLPGMRDSQTVSGHYLSLDQVVPGFGQYRC
jgi:ankyrin repeat protein